MENKKIPFSARMKEACRKFIVSLKHKPQTIPMVMMAITFLYYSLCLTHVSDATAAINRTPMGLCGFVTMLFSMLALVCFMNAFPHRKPVNKVMLSLMIAMTVAILAADILYTWILIQTVVGPNPVKVTPSQVDIMNKVMQDLWVHGIMLLISLALVALLPVYSKMLRKIDTSVEVEAGQEMASLDAAE